ncbi:MAG: prolipoprotein diacylglyceryl transferase [Planctomycetes bacterium]|nr:prolipoprotein diacylglyceryl transferase [Planctomycetota bacterium]
MRPRLFEIPLGLFSLPVNSYGFMLMLGFLFATVVGARRGRALRIDADFIMDLSVWMMISGVVGSRVLYVAEYWQDFSFSFLDLRDGRINVWALVAGWCLPLAARVVRQRRGERVGAPSAGAFAKDVARTIAWCAVLGLACGRVGALIEFRREYDFGMFRLWEGGITFYGGLLGAVGFAVYYVRARGESFLRVADLLAPTIMLGFAFGRVGCFLNGCCYGTVVAEAGTASPPWWAIRFPRLLDEHGLVTGSPAWLDHVKDAGLAYEQTHSHWVHPTQFYSIVGNLLLFAFLSWRWRRRVRIGQVVCEFALSYAVLRFLLELFRGDNAHAFFGLTISQFISVIAFVITLPFYWRIRWRTPPLTGSYPAEGVASPVPEVREAPAAGGTPG